MSLKDWERFKFITPHKSSEEEIRNLFAIADRDLKDCHVEAVSIDRRFEIAYNAALQVATAALFAAGYRAGRESHHYYIIESLKHTIGIESSALNKFRLKRSQANYEFSGVVSVGELAEMIGMAVDLRAKAETWIGDKFPDLLKRK